MLGRTNAVTAAKEQKTVTAGTEQIIITPAKGKLLSEVKVNPTPSQAKNVTPTDASQTVEPDEGKLLNSVTIQGIPNSAKAGEYAWRKKVAIDDAFLGFVVNDDESAFPDDGTQDNYYYKKVVVDTSPIQYTYTGSSTLSTGVDSDGNPTWELKLLTSGTLNIKEMLTPIQDVFLVGGGGGGATGRSGGGGAGGGGNALISNTTFDRSISSGEVNTGGGGAGGASNQSTSSSRQYDYAGSAGGSGIIILRGRCS